MSLFDRGAPAVVPLAERLRPRTLAELLGQEQVLGEGRMLRAAIAAGKTGSLILWGPPGVGKTTLALLVAQASGLHFEPFSAVLGGIAEVRAAIARAQQRQAEEQRGTLLFIDEIHRFNKAQQDAFLPWVERGVVVLVGATTENPAFAVIGALLSRCRVVALEPLSDAAVAQLLDAALADRERGLGALGLRFSEAGRALLVGLAGGDARKALTALESAAAGVLPGGTLEPDVVREAFQHRTLAHDKDGDHHYDLLSALHKSLRNSDVQATVYWLARLIEAGADPLQAARRMVAMAAEDVGLADPMALQVATSALTAVQQLGLPEGRLPLTEAAIYLAAAPKSNSVLAAIDAATDAVRHGAQHPVPLHLRNAPTKLAKQAGHGEGYRYAHDHAGGVAPMACLPPGLEGRRFYQPGERGFEQRIAERLRDADQRRQP